jgi:hypothetical protein
MNDQEYAPKPIEDILLKSDGLKLTQRMKEILAQEIRRERRESFWLGDLGDDLASECFTRFERGVNYFKRQSDAEFTTSVQHYIRDRIEKSKEFKDYRLASLGHDEKRKISHTPIDDMVGTGDEYESVYLSSLTDVSEKLDLEEFIAWCELIRRDGYCKAYLTLRSEEEAAKRFGISVATFCRILKWLEAKFAPKAQKGDIRK